MKKSTRSSVKKACSAVECKGGVGVAIAVAIGVGGTSYFI